MSMKKAIDQTIRDLKREVNKKVLKVPSIEQKVLDATSNEPWGPHGSILADIAQASRNYHEYQMIMTIIWKRINDTGKNWRHVYKALTVLEYLVANGSERVIDEIREHAYQISTLSDFQYIDSSGRDQGNNVRRKSQSLVLLVNDKERIQEARQKAAINRDRFRSTSAVGGMYQPGSGAYGDDRYSYGRDRNDERYGPYGDSYSREGDRYGGDSYEHYGRDMYRDEESRGRSRSVDGQHGPRSRSANRDGHAYDDIDDRHSAGSMERKFSEQNLGTPPSYEEAVGDSRNPTFGERDGETPAESAPQSSSPTAAVPQSSPPVADTAVQSSSPTNGTNNSNQAAGEHGAVSHPNMAANGFEFDPRGSAAAVPTPSPLADAPSSSNNAEMDLFGSLSEVFSSNPLAVMPASSGATEQANAMNTDSNAVFTASMPRNDVSTQSFEDPFGESPFKAIQSDEPHVQPQNLAPMSSFQPVANSVEHNQPAAQKLETTANVDFPDALAGIEFNAADISNAQTVPTPQPSQDHDILAGILPPSGALPFVPSSFAVSNGAPPVTSQTTFPSFGQTPSAGFMPQSGPSPTPYQQITVQNMNIPPFLNQQNPPPYPSHSMMSSSMGHQTQTVRLSHQNSGSLVDLLPQTRPTIPSSSQSAPNLLELVPNQQFKETQKFEPKSAVWADTLSKGLVDLNISGPKCNPTADIGVDFESLNRREKRMEKPSATPTTSTVSMGKAMGSGSGIGRAGAMRAPSNPMTGHVMGMGMGMGGYGSMNQHPMGMGMGMGMGMNMGGMNMGMRPGAPMQPPNGLPHGSNMGSYNPVMGRGGYPQQPFGGGYR